MAEGHVCMYVCMHVCVHALCIYVHVLLIRQHRLHAAHYDHE